MAKGSDMTIHGRMGEANTLDVASEWRALYPAGMMGADQFRV
jgi:hypothetical protein